MKPTYPRWRLRPYPARKETLATEAHKETPAHKVSKVFRACAVSKETPAHKVRREIQETQGPPANAAHKVCAARLAPVEHKGPRVIRAYRASKVSKVSKVSVA